jgi:hypothetical protein
VAAGLSVPELPRGLRVDRRDEEEERRNARRVDLVTREAACETATFHTKTQI